MISLIAFSSVFNFVLFLIQMKSKSSAAKEDAGNETVDFYNAGTKTTYYQTDQSQQKLANAK